MEATPQSDKQIIELRSMSSITELLNMREKSEMKLHLAANMCRGRPDSFTSRTVDAEPDNTLNTLSPGKNSRWILPHELATPGQTYIIGTSITSRCSSSIGPSPMTQEYSATPPGACSTSSMG